MDVNGVFFIPSSENVVSRNQSPYSLVHFVLENHLCCEACLCFVFCFIRVEASLYNIVAIYRLVYIPRLRYVYAIVNLLYSLIGGLCISYKILKHKLPHV